MLRNLLLATCVAAIPSVALAQNASQNATPQNAQQSQMAGKFLAMPAAGQIRAADLRAADIYTADNQKVGDIDDILLDSRGNIIAVVVGVGGFLGIGEKNVAIPFEALDMMHQNNMAGATGVNTGANTAVNTGVNTSSTTTTNRDGMTTGAVPNNTAAATDQDRQRATAQRAEQMSREQAAAQRGTTTTTTTTATNQRMAQMDGPWKPERILLKGVTKAELQSAPEFNWDARSRRGAGTSNAPDNTPANRR